VHVLYVLYELKRGRADRARPEGVQAIALRKGERPRNGRPSEVLRLRGICLAHYGRYYVRTYHRFLMLSTKLPLLNAPLDFAVHCLAKVRSCQLYRFSSVHYRSLGTYDSRRAPYEMPEALAGGPGSCLTICAGDREAMPAPTMIPGYGERESLEPVVDSTSKGG
jgi:hypothetical protein